MTGSESARPGASPGAEPSELGPAWQTWAADLAARITALADGGALTVTFPRHTRQGVKRPARLFGLIPPSYADVVPTLTLTRSEDHLHGTFTGSESIGGLLPTSPEEDAALEAATWRNPGHSLERVWLRYWPDDVALQPYLSAADTHRAVEVVLDTAAVFGITDPADVTADVTVEGIG